MQRWMSAILITAMFISAPLASGALADADLVLTLEGALKFQSREHDVELTLRRRNGKLEPLAWGYAPTLSTMLHPARVTTETNDGGTARLRIDLDVIAEHTGVPGAAVDWHYSPPRNDYFSPIAKAEWMLKLNDDLSGAYEGTCGGKNVAGKMRGRAEPPYPRQSAAGAAARKEHPRLLFAKADLPLLRKRADTPQGQRILQRMREQLATQEKGGFSYSGLRKGTGAEPYTEGYHLATYAFLHLLTDEPMALDNVRRLLPEAMNAPGEMGGWGAANRILGVALAWDMVGDQLDQPTQRSILKFLSDRALSRSGPPDSHYHAGFQALALVCAVAVDGHLESPDAARKIAHAEEFLRRYFQTGMGQRGFGGEYAGQGELLREVLPALFAFRHATGRDLIANTGLEWLGAQKLMVPSRRNAMFSFSHALLAARPEHVPAILWAMEQDDNGFRHPNMGIYALVTWPFGARPAPPKDVLPLTLHDEPAGAFVQRSGWGADDFVVTIDAKQHAVAAPASAMDFSIRGLGRSWIEWRPPDYGVFWLMRPERHKPNAPRLPGLLPMRGARITDWHLDANGSGQVSMLLDHYARARPWVFKTSSCFEHRIEDPASVGASVDRTFAVDYSGQCGAPALIIVADRIRGAGQVVPVWSLNLAEGVVPSSEALAGKSRDWKLPRREIERRLAEWLTEEEKGGEPGKPPTIEALPDGTLLLAAVEGRRRDADASDTEVKATMSLTVLAGPKLMLSMQPTFHGRNLSGGRILATAGAGQADFLAVITIQRGDPPPIKIEGEGIDARITVGGRTVRFDNGKIVLGQ